MSNNRCTYQQENTVSIPKKPLLEYVVSDDKLKKTDLRIILLLLTELNGWTNSKRKTEDPHNFKMIDTFKISEELEIHEKDVKKSIKRLVHKGILEIGDSYGTTVGGYRFTF